MKQLRSVVQVLSMTNNTNSFLLFNKQRIKVSVISITPNFRPDASVVCASGSGQLQANPHVVGPWLFPGKPTRRVVTIMGSNDLVVGEDHMLGPSFQRYNWQTGRCGSISFGSSPRRWKTLISNPRCLAELSTCGNDFRR